MLNLTQRTGNTICIGDNIKVTVLKISGKQVVLGIDAPREIEVDREEVRLRKIKERECQQEKP